MTTKALGFILRNSRPLEWHRVAVGPAAQSAIAHLLDRLEAGEIRQRARRTAERRRLSATLEAMVMDLYVAARLTPGVHLAYYRRKEAWSNRTRYHNLLVTYTNVVRVADFLVAAGLAAGACGYYVRRPPELEAYAHGFCSRIIATERLVSLLEDRFGVTLDDVGLNPMRETIIIKGCALSRGAGKPLIDYMDTPKTTGMRERLQQINACLASADIRLAEEGMRILEARGLSMDPTSRTMHRVFNNGSLALGGRFYGGFWQTLPWSARRHLLVDGEEVTELDFRSLHPRLCYALSGIPLRLDKDPYRIPGLSRPLVKRAFNQLLNAAPRMRLSPDERIRHLIPPDMTYEQVLAAVERRHEGIAAWFRSGRGLELQGLDAAIAEEVMMRLMPGRGITVLPIHDSFIVARRHEVDLGRTMVEAFHAVVDPLARTRAEPAINGWSGDTRAEGRRTA